MVDVSAAGAVGSRAIRAQERHDASRVLSLRRMPEHRLGELVDAAVDPLAEPPRCYFVHGAPYPLAVELDGVLHTERSTIHSRRCPRRGASERYRFAAPLASSSSDQRRTVSGLTARVPVRPHARAFAAVVAERL